MHILDVALGVRQGLLVVAPAFAHLLILAFLHDVEHSRTMNRTNAPSHIHIHPYNHLAQIQARCIPPPSPDFARPSSRASSLSHCTTSSRQTSSHDLYSSAQFASSHHNVHHQHGFAMHTTLLNAIRRSRSHAHLMDDHSEPEAPAYIDPSELYEPPPLPMLEGEESVEDAPEE